MGRPIRVLVVDDSAFNRVTLGKMLQAMDGVEVVGFASNGEDGLRTLFDLRPDLVTLDLEMPGMGGLRMLQILMRSCPVPVIVVSSLAEEQYVFRALELGAVDFVAKPGRPVSQELYSLRKDLELKVRAAAEISFPPSGVAERAAARCIATQPSAQLSSAAVEATAVVIGASTGGPRALDLLFSEQREPFPIAFAVAQHMPPGFTHSLAERLNEKTVFNVREACDGDRMRPGQVLICPGGKNLELQRDASGVVARVTTPLSEQIYTPSVDRLFSSAASAYAQELLAVVLTGMGNDGAAGALKVHAHGGGVLAEAEQSCVVYGMPKEAVATGIVEQSVPLSRMWQEIRGRCHAE